MTLSNCNHCSKYVGKKLQKGRKNIYCSKECYWKSLIIPQKQKEANIKNRFHTLYNIDSNGCWIWNKCLNASGYGQLTLYYKRKRAHRLSWELLRGPIPNGMIVCHKCDVRNCVNPDHLFIGTYSDNARDTFNKGRNNKNSFKNLLGYEHYGNGKRYNSGTPRTIERTDQEAKQQTTLP